MSAAALEPMEQLVDELLALQFCELLLEERLNLTVDLARSRQLKGYLGTVRQMCADRRAAAKGKL